VVQIAGERMNIGAQQAGARRRDKRVQVTVLAWSCRVGFVAQALVIFPSSLKSLRKWFFHGSPGILPLQFFQVACHLGRDLIKLFAAVSGVESRFEAQEVEFLGVSELPARFEMVFQSCIHVRLVFVGHALLCQPITPQGPDGGFGPPHCFTPRSPRRKFRSRSHLHS
jgi:hypothetical protein